MPIKILIVEDEPIVAADLADRLQDAGYTSTSTSRGENAVEIARDVQPDLILMDVNLAGKMDGIEAAAAILKTRQVPIVFLTSNSDGPTFERARTLQPRGFLTKPFRGRDVLNTVALAVGTIPNSGGEASPGAKEEIMSDRLFIQHKGRMVRLMLADILYVSADDYYCRVVTADQEYLVTKTLKRLSAEFPPSAPFLRVHRSYLINLRQVSEIGEMYVFLDKHQVPISRAKREELKRALRSI